MQYLTILDFERPKHGDLSAWAKQGVFLLNDALTVKEGSPKSHKNIPWNFFTNSVIKLINSKCNGVVFMLWGSHAQKKATFIDTSKVTSISDLIDSIMF